MGVFVLLSPGGSGADNPWLLLAIVAALFWSTGSFYGRRLTQPADPFVGAVVQMIVAGTIMLVAGVAIDGLDALDPTAAVGALAGSRSLYLAVAGAAALSAPTSGRSSTSRSRRS